MNNVLNNLIFPVLASVISGLILNYVSKRRLLKTNKKSCDTASEGDGAVRKMFCKSDMRTAMVMLAVFCVVSLALYSQTKTIEYENGDRYVGRVEDNQPDGRGTCYYADGSRYVGRWKDGLRDGKGILYYANGGRYEGEF